VVRAFALAAALLLLPTCSAILDFNQCNVDADCARRFNLVDMGTAYCTADHICVTDFPADRICTVSEASKTSPDAVTIAGLFRITGPSDVVDTDLVNAAVLAVSEINQQGGRPIRLVLCDTNGDPDQAKKALATAAERFGAVAGVGPTSSAEVVALASDPDFLVKKYGFLAVSCSSTAPRVTSLNDNNLIWRTAASDNLQAKVLATLVPAGTTSVATAYIDSTYGSGLKDAFTVELAKVFVPPLVPPANAFAEGTPGASVVSFLQMSSPQVALIVADSDAPAWVAALNNGGPALMSTKYLLTDGSKAPALFSQNPSTDVLRRITGTAPATPSGPAFAAFQATYMGQFGKNPSDTAFVANAYDATYVIAIAMGAVPVGVKVTGTALIAGMTSLSDPNGLPVRVGPGEFGAGYARLADGGTINLDGTSGPIDFDPTTGDILSAPIEIWDVDTSGPTPAFRTLQNVTP
jgi:branched-chain amino acid transport system substrate-binding protein